jgi:UDP-N-acetylmuramoyl-tripeptide--D-alanyl-D-alanine ligase
VLGWLFILPVALFVIDLISLPWSGSSTPASILFAVMWLGVGLYLLYSGWRNKEAAKKPLVYTARAKRLLVTSTILQALAPVVLIILALGSAPAIEPKDGWILLWVAGAAALAAILAPFSLIVANIVLFPFDEFMRQRYLRLARNRLSGQSTTVIGITGSYGKTSTKDILAQLLSTRYRVSKTPRSFNTLMGLSRVINDGVVKQGDQYFVTEMGAYKPGEIKRLCDLVKPAIGILTAVGPMHLERFKTIENVARAKYELIQSLGQDGLAVFNADDDICYRLAQQTHHVPVALYGIEKHLDELAVRAEDISVTQGGCSFTIVYTANGQSMRCETRLLGRHNISNILAASAVALRLGVKLKDIAFAVKRMEASPHRLELKKGSDGITILDDSYNSNPSGARNALEILAGFNDAQRILVTPGFVELGDIEAEENKKLGVLAARSCDLAILVGRNRTAPICEGLRQTGFAEDHIMQVASLQEAIGKLRTYAKAGDTVLLLNDLPDTYELAAS